MKILVVEDTNNKLEAILVELSINGCTDVDTAKSASDARNLLSKKQYQLVLLDVVIPNYNDGTAQDEHGLNLLREMHEADYLMQPGYIVGITGYLEIASSAKQQFDELLWTLITYENATNNWRIMLHNIINHIFKTTECALQNYDRTDLCIITALKEPEFSSVLKYPWNWQSPEPLDHQTFIRRGSLSVGEKNFSVVAAHAPRMGMVASALLTSKLLTVFHPKVFAMVGICAGVRGRADLCDVVISTESWDWQSGKHVISDDGSSFQIEPDFIKASESLKAKCELIELSDRLKIFASDNAEGESITIPKIILGPMASGSAVISDRSVLGKIVTQNRKTVAVDMECYGMYCAAYRAATAQPEFICIKAVSDFGDETKSDDVQIKCALNSAKTLQYIVEKHAESIFA